MTSVELQTCQLCVSSIWFCVSEIVYRDFSTSVLPHYRARNVCYDKIFGGSINYASCKLREWFILPKTNRGRLEERKKLETMRPVILKL